MRNQLFIFFLCTLLVIQSKVQASTDIEVNVSAPATAIMGRPFQLRYTINARVTDFRAPAITNFDVLAGPFLSESVSSQVINGQMSTSISVTYTYTLQPQKTGTFSIPPATVIVDDQTISTTGATIRVLPADENTNNQRQSPQSQNAAASINAQNIFIRPILSRNSVYENEAVRLTYKLYTTYDITRFNVKNMPNFEGFLSQELERSSNTQLAYENYNGRNFLTAVLFEIILFPQSAGELQIDRATFEAIIRVQNRQPTRSIFDDFFESYTNVAHEISVPAIRINVRPLPSGKPATFAGLLGSFTINSDLSSNEVMVNEAITLKVNISGSGNMRMLNNPNIKFPEAFDVFDPKVTNRFNPSSQGLTGTKTIEYTIIPRHSGRFEIPASEMFFFSPTEGSYKALRTPVYTVQVLKSDGTVDESPVVSNFTRKEDIRRLGNDIRHIHVGSVVLVPRLQFFIHNPIVWFVFIVLPFLLAVVVFVVFRKHVKDNAEIEMVKTRRANKVAVKRLKLASKLLKLKQMEPFYAEIMNALWIYLSDKLTIPVAELNKERVLSHFNSLEVQTELQHRVMEILYTCEMARFAPNAGQHHTMGNLYQETVAVISLLEKSIKR